MLKKILLGVLGLVLVVLGYAASKPNEFKVERSISIKASPEKIYPLVNGFAKWDEWSPWSKLDLNMKKTFSGPAVGVGAKYEWEGNKEVGKGSMEITKSDPNLVVMKLDFIEPFDGHNITEFELVWKEPNTVVNWKMTGPSPFVSKVFGLFMNMDKMIGSDFEKGLANIKAIVEK